MVYRITHVTSYDYSDAVSICHNEARLTPRATPHQRVIRSQLLVEPPVASLFQDTDYFGNVTHWFSLEEAHTRLSVTAVSEVAVTHSDPPAPGLTGPWESTRDRVKTERTPESLAAYELTFESVHVKLDADLAAYALVSFTPGRSLLEAALDLTRRIHTEFQYEPGATTVATPPREVLRARRGVCQDFAHLEIAMLRSLGLPVRYVSGYVFNRPQNGAPVLTGADASHAWVSLYVPEVGWVDLDPTNGVIPDDEHVTVAWGRDYSDASPLKGVILGGGAHQLKVAVEVARV
jgi:transglutaminase-like putative cysteine protease